MRLLIRFNKKVFSFQIGKALYSIIIFMLVFAWVFSGWPRIYGFPPETQTVHAIPTTQHPSDYTLTTGFDLNFANPTNAYSSNDQYATATDSKPRNKEWATNWRGFDFSGIPTGSTINSVTVHIEERMSAACLTGEWRSSAWEDVTSSAALAPGTIGALDGGTQYTRPTTDTSDYDWNYSLSSVPTLSQLQATNFGVRVQYAQGRDGSIYTAYVDDVYITVDYTAPNHSPSVTPNTSDGTNFGSDTTPTLEFTGTDLDNDDVRYNIQICSTSNCSSVLLDKVSGTDLGFAGSPDNSDPFVSGQLVSYTVQASEALSDGTYYWQVRGIDPSGTNTYGSWATIRNFQIGAVAVSVSVSDGDIAYGGIPLGSERDTTATGINDTQTATNDGTVTEDFNIRTSNAIGGTTWAVGTSAGSNIYVHSFSTNSGSSWEILDAADSYETLATGIASSDTQDFDLKIGTPTATSDYVSKSITITIQAVEN